MKTIKKKSPLRLLLTMMPAMVIGSVCFGEVSYIVISSDADSEISSDKDYTHAIDFGTSGTATVDGVVFVNDINVASSDGRANSGSRTYGPSPHAGNAPPAVTGNVASVFTDMHYNGSDLSYIELTGLTAGNVYDVRLYERAWDFQGSIRTFYAAYDVGGDGTVEFKTEKINQNDPTLTPPGLAGNVSYALSYKYTADSTGKIKVIVDLADDQTGTYHLYGLTNEDLGPDDPNAPSVDAGDNLISWSGQATPMNPTVSNNDPANPELTYLWTAEPADNVVFSDPADPTNPSPSTSLAPAVTITGETDDPTVVTLTLTVTRPGSEPVSNRIKVKVYDDSCDAAVANGAVIDEADIDENCIVDLADFSLQALAWLVDYSSTGPVPK